ncbi:IclR family transcriptional regulator [Rhizorhapis sp. SPR117]|uniref:IclR family transcriptional regulator n=1 Tax=Rhizorhapis sp. SPR117 TaxID=2912611 RepID=UPI001F32CB67|nr:IclR family transcriptional regulator [Rhizorhapis sp. SPR117]
MASLDKSLSLLTAVVEDRGRRPFSVVSAERGLPAPTAYRILAALKKHDLLESGQRGYYVPGKALRRLGWHASMTEVAAAACRPVLQELSRQTGHTVHLGTLEDWMVTYIVKVPSTEDSLLTREGMQLEAYCSAIGKALLAGLSNNLLQEYLNSGTFYELTERTITDPDRLKDELCRIKQGGLAIDDCEVDDQLRCLAIGITDDPLFLAVSIAKKGPAFNEAELNLHSAQLRKCAQILRSLLFRCLA